MLPFEKYPNEGRIRLGSPKSGDGRSRTGYGLNLQRVTGQDSCAYCGVSFVDDYYHWLLLTVDHVVPRGQAKLLGIPIQYYEDAINLVLACSGCNGFLNLYTCEVPGLESWTDEAFATYRDSVFVDRSERIARQRKIEQETFAMMPWMSSVVAPSFTPAVGKSAVAEITELVLFTDNDAGYLAWIDANPTGYIVNTTRNPTANYLVLHASRCRSITAIPTKGSRWTGDYIKICSNDLATLTEWARSQVSGSLSPCKLCKPLKH